MTSGVLRGPELGLPDLDALLIPQAAAERFRAAGLAVDYVEANYVRLKPGMNALVGYLLHGKDGDGGSVTLPGYARTFADGKAQILAQKWTGGRAVETALGPGAALLRGGRTFLFVFPNDHGLRRLRKILGTANLESALRNIPGFQGERVRVHELTAVRYKPERRFIASVELEFPRLEFDRDERRRFFMRFYPDGRGARIAETARVLQAHAGNALVPTPVGTVLDGRLSLEEEIRGDDILRVILDRRVDGAELGEVLRSLHGRAEGFGAPRTPNAVLSALAGSVNMAGSIDQGLAGTAREVVRRLGKMVPPERPPTLVHGDLALHNILYTRSGPVLVDLERAGMGDPLQDVGQLVAHLRELARRSPEARASLGSFEEQLIESYAPGSDMEGNLQRLAFFTGCSLVDRAAGAVIRRGLDVWWPARAAELLRLALEVTRGASSIGPTFFVGATARQSGLQWEIFYPKLEPEWPGFLEDASGQPVYGVYDAHRDAFREVRPENDAALPSLARWVGQGELVKYRVGRRATVRIRPGSDRPAAYVKILPPRKARKALRRHQAVERAMASASTETPLIPRLVEWAPDEGIIVVEALPGRSLRDLILAGSPEVEGALDMSARAVAQLHEIPGGALDAPKLRPSMELHHYAALVSDHFPDRASTYRLALQELNRALRQRTTSEDRLVHGDLHDGNVLIHGDRAAILDLDLVHRGDPVEDVGNLAAHLFLRALQRGVDPDAGRADGDRFVDAYSRAGATVDRRGFRAVGASVLFRLACIYLFRRRWRNVTPALLEECVRWAHQSRSKEALTWEVSA
jgi:aminoglycoside phosphotransferase (APT) family kinase protein